MRFDSGFWSNATLATLERLEVGYTMGVAMVKSVVKAVGGIDESAWTPIDYTADGEAEVAECDYKGRRLIVRRTRLTGSPGDAVAAVGVTSPSSPTSRAKRWISTTSTVRMPPSSSPSATSKRERASSTSPRDTSSPTRVARMRGACARPHPLDRHAR